MVCLQGAKRYGGQGEKWAREMTFEGGGVKRKEKVRECDEKKVRIMRPLRNRN